MIASGSRANGKERNHFRIADYSGSCLLELRRQIDHF